MFLVVINGNNLKFFAYLDYNTNMLVKKLDILYVIILTQNTRNCVPTNLYNFSHLRKLAPRILMISHYLNCLRAKRHIRLKHYFASDERGAAVEELQPAYNIVPLNLQPLPPCCFGATPLSSPHRLSLEGHITVIYNYILS